MNTNQPVISTYLLNSFFALLCVLGCGGCVVTGFSLPVDTSVFYPISVTVSLVLPVIFLPSVRASEHNAHPWTMFFILLPMSLPLIWFLLRTDTLTEGFLFLAAIVMRHLCLGFPGLSMPDLLTDYEREFSTVTAESPRYFAIKDTITEASVFSMIILAFLFGFFYVFYRAPLVAGLLPLPFFILCFLIIDATMPSMWALLLLLCYWLFMFFTGSTATLHSGAALAQIAVLLLPSLLLLWGSYRLFPRDTSVRDVFDSAYQSVVDVLASAERFFKDSFADNTGMGWFTVSAEGDQIDFSSLGRRRYSGRTVMRVKSDTEGLYYLRENTYDLYTVTGWSDAPDSLPADFDPAIALSYSAELLAHTGATSASLSLYGARSPLLFIPYYSTDVSVPFTVDSDRNYQNTKREPDYSMTVYRFDGFDAYEAATGVLGSESALSHMQALLRHYLEQTEENYLQIDPTLRERLRDILEENGILRKQGNQIMYGNTFRHTVSEITDFVQTSAQYSLDAELPPTDKDFVLWFLEDAEVGYCTHFATAEVMLLRAAGIPARLAAGFLVGIENTNKKTPVRDSNAHAWVEVFDGRIGWVAVEATPPGSVTGTEHPTNPETQTEAVSQTESDAMTETEPITQTPPSSDTEEPTTTEPDGGIGIGGIGDGGIGIGGNGHGNEPTFSALLPFFGTVGIVIAVCGGISVGIIITFRTRQRKLSHLSALLSGNTAQPNETALYLYRRLLHLSRLTGIAPEDSVHVLAEKAKFSRHTLTRSELAQIGDGYVSLSRQLAEQEKKKPFARFVHRFIDVCY